MKFLVDEDLPKSSLALLRRYGHEAISVREAGLRGAKDYQIASYCKANRLCLLTGDFDFADVRNYPPADFPGIVVISIPNEATAKFALRLIDDFLQQNAVVSALSGKLAIVEPGRIRLRKFSAP